MMADMALGIDAVAARATLAREAAERADSAGDATELQAYASALDEIASSITFLDRHDLEVRHQLGWWTTRVEELERERAASTADPLIVRELALFRGRISGAQAMVRHYQAERDALAALLAATNERYGALLDAQ